MFRSSAHALIGFAFWLSCMSCLHILEIKSLLVSPFAAIFSQSVDSLSILFMVSFVVQKLASLIRSHFLIFALISTALEDWPMTVYVRECFAYVFLQEFYGVMSLSRFACISVSVMRRWHVFC